MNNGKPWVYEAKKAHEEKRVVYDEQKNAYISFEAKTICVPPSHQYNLTHATLFGLNERLTLSSTSPTMEGGETLRDFFNEEWERFQEALFASEQGGPLDYGVYAYYPEKNDLVLYAPRFWHKIVSVASSSKLIAGKNNLTWREIRNIFESAVIGIVGCSVGGSIAHSCVMDLRMNTLKIADKSLYKMENINRVRLSYDEIVKNNEKHFQGFSLPLKNKAETTAAQIYAMDPFLDIFVYNEGLHEGNIHSFFEGSEAEPKLDLIVEEVDDPKMKIFIRVEARKRKIPLLMMTDVGSSVQMDVLRYDLDNSLPLSFGVSDEELYQKMKAVDENPGNKSVFFDFVSALIGTDYRTGELLEILEGRSEIPTSTLIPQLGSTVAVAGGIAAEHIARLLLGDSLPSRMIFNKKTFEVKMW